MKRKNISTEEMELRNDKDVINAKKMVAEGGPPVHEDELIADSESEKSDKKNDNETPNKR